MKIFDFFKRDPTYLLVLSCTNERAEKAAFAYVNQNVRKNILKKKTVYENCIELTSTITLNNASTYFVNELLGISGVVQATLLYDKDQSPVIHIKKEA